MSVMKYKDPYTGAWVPIPGGTVGSVVVAEVI